MTHKTNQFAFLFPGQGSQSVGMMSGFANIGDDGDSSDKIIYNTFEEASDILGLNLWQMVTEPNDFLNQTINTQPIMLTAGVATWRAWAILNEARPSVMAGHSLGEYTALVAAEAISFADALPLVKYRAEVMQNAVPDGVGAMAAILGLDDATVLAVCSEAAQGEVLEAVNLNSPGQVVIAGHQAAVERGMALAKEKGAKRALALPVSVPSHCALMKPAANQLREYLASVHFNSPKIAVLHNADVVSYSDSALIKDALVRQLYSPVRWVETIQAIAALGVINTAECGPGKVLTGLTKRIVSGLPCVALINHEALISVL